MPNLFTLKILYVIILFEKRFILRKVIGMNQILVTKNDKSKKVKEKKVREPKAPGDITGVAKAFAGIILLFGLALSADGAYAYTKNVELAKNTKAPIVSVLKTGNTAKLSIECTSGIRTVSFTWNNSNPTIVQGRGNKILEQIISIPSGENNKLNITVIDSNGQTKRYVKTLNQDAKDITEPVITIEGVNSNIKITVTDDTAIDYVTYKYGDSQEVTISAEEEGQTTIEETIPAQQGEATLTIEAVDKAQNVATKEQKIKGTKRPTVEVKRDPNDASYILIKATDDDGLRLLCYDLNGQGYTTDPNISINDTKFEYRQKLDSGTNKISLRVYNINEQVTEFNAEYEN